MSKLPLATPTNGQTGSIDGQDYRADTTTYPHVVLATQAPAATTTDPNTLVSDAQRAELIALGNIPDTSYTQPTTLPTGTAAILRYVEDNVFAYRSILTTGRSVYSLTEPS